MIVNDSVTITSSYVPAWHFLLTAQKYSELAQESCKKSGGDDGEISLIFSAMVMEAFIAQEIYSRVPASQQEVYFRHPNDNILRRWFVATSSFAKSSTLAQAALGQIRQSCKEDDSYGLLVRSRNKLIHAKVHTEVMDDAGKVTLDASIERLVSAFRSKVPGIPVGNPVFPDVVTCYDATVFFLATVKYMIGKFYAAVEEPVPTNWQ